jgi:uncharacterized protein (TIRG00374 family)
VAAIVGFVVFVVPHINGIGATVTRLRAGDAWWLVFGALVEAGSLAAYAAVFHSVFTCGEHPLGWRPSVQITLAGNLATKFLATAGAGSVALTVWALRAFGLSSQQVARRMVSLEVLLYAVFFGSIVVAGLALWTGLAPSRAPAGVTLVPAVAALILIALAASSVYASKPIRKWLTQRASKASPNARGRWNKVLSLFQALPDGILTAVSVVRARPATAIASFLYWALDIAALWASFNAFGYMPALPVLVLGYFLGALGNALPVPGGIGGVEGGMIGVFLAFGVPGSVAVLAVLAYRAISYWLPTLPGLVAYARLRGTVGSWREASAARPAASA